MIKYPKRTALEAIRFFCVECQGGSFQGVTECHDLACAFFPYRHGEYIGSGQHKPTGAIKAYCQACCEDVKGCGGDTAVLGPCPVFPFRLGVNPNITAETRERMRQSAIKNNPLGLIQRPFDAPGSTKSRRATL